MSAEQRTRTEGNVSLTLEDQQIPSLFQILQQGFMVKVRLGCSVREMLCGQLDLDPRYVDERIKTIFFDGKPVDDIDSAIIKEGSTLALSGAMPGLVGATFRRGGHLAPFRSQITYHEEGKSIDKRRGMLVLKLFNLLVTELGPSFLEKGLWVKGDALMRFLKGRPAAFWSGCKEIKVDGREMSAADLLKEKWLENKDLLFLKIGVSQ